MRGGHDTAEARHRRPLGANRSRLLGFERSPVAGKRKNSLLEALFVFPALRRATVETSLLDQAEADGRAIVSIAERIEDADDDPAHPLLADLAARFPRRVKSDELEFWPAARRSSADLADMCHSLKWACKLPKND
jgi:hypothetical protein